MKYDKQYDDIINLPHHVSKKHPQMSLYARSAQFAPFAALTGYEDAIKETSRETSEKIDIDDELKSILDSKLQIIMEHIKNKPEISFTYFIPDSKKDGGSYITVIGIVRKIDLYNQIIYLANNTEIPINDIINISGEIFKMYE
ncbi:MAG TPA: hypothetical protein IAD08_01305 [Candidatus Scatovivens faecipullorum]|nr:hypothetical protein [Candidatus Scatovivens faecipullorum]